MTAQTAEPTLHQELAAIGVTSRPTTFYAMRALLAADGEVIKLADSVQGWDFIRQARSAA